MVVWRSQECQPIPHGRLLQERDMKFRKLLYGGTVLAGLTVFGLVGTARPALAGDQTAGVSVGATVVASCTLTESADVNLSNYSANAGSDETDDSGALTYQCSDGATATIQLSEGNSNSYSERYMTDGSDDLNYNIFTTNGGSTVWGNGTGSSTVAATADGSSHTQNIYVVVPHGQFVEAGTYSDTVTAEIDY
jgi:spore coat protein U-like protein